MEPAPPTALSPSPTDAAWRAFWGKWGFADDRDDPDPPVHPLACHMVDVAHVARAIWDQVLSPSTRSEFARALGLSHAEDAAGWVAVLAGLHDLGKATRAFSEQKPRSLSALEACGLSTRRLHSDPPPQTQRHSIATARLLPPLLQAELGVGDVAAQAARFLGGHHGLFPTASQIQTINPREVNDVSWNLARRDLVRALVQALDAAGLPPIATLDTRSALLLAGLTTVADWIGSNTTYFKYAATLSTLGREPGSLPSYAAGAADQAQHALRDLGWTRHLATPARSRLSDQHSADLFRDLFQKNPRPVQGALVDLSSTLSGGGLVIVEAPTGEGKTEAALYLLAHWLREQRVRGAYFALPTQATSNQMFQRFKTFLARVFPSAAVELQLLHGHASLSAELALLRELGEEYRALFGVQNLYDEEALSSRDRTPPDVVASEWFTYRKRGLLAPYGVGTVDQALLGALVTRHVFVRLFGLADKAVIVDEVHAYDTYMSTILERLLGWLGALGTPVVLLSATLPSARKQALAAAYAAGAGWQKEVAAPPDEASYPRVTWSVASGGGVRTVATSPLGSKRVSVRWVDGTRPDAPEDPFPLGARLAEALADGGCAAVICNTVSSAQQTYAALRRYFRAEDTPEGERELDLFHARYQFGERSRREERALRRFGPPSDGSTAERPRRAVLVATQVIEQSLDLDFDLLVSEMAPVDLLLQRLGRVWRHTRSWRPPSLAGPTLWLVEPPLDDAGVPRFPSSDAHVYAPHILLRSWYALRARTEERPGCEQALHLDIPADVADLVESVYDDRACPDDAPHLRAAWESTRARLADEEEDRLQQASIRTIPDPCGAAPLTDFTRGALDEDDPETHPRFQAMTRLGPPTVTTVVVFQHGDRWTLDPEGTRPVQRARPPTLDEVQEILRHAIPVANQGLSRWLLAQRCPRVWQKSPLLRFCRVLELQPTASEDQSIVGRATPDGYPVHLDSDLGLVVSPRPERRQAGISPGQPH